MKKILIVILTLIVFASLAYAALNMKSVGNTTGDLIVTGSGNLKGLIIHTDGTNSVTVTVYDNTSATGSKLFSTFTVTTSSANRTTTIGFDDKECPFFTGIYVDVTTSGNVTYDVYYDKI
jgi:uncharacterized protein YxeA